MNKKRFLVIFLFCCCIFAIVAMNAEVTNVKGKVEIRKGSSWVKAKEGTKLAVGDLVSTGFKSEMTVKIDGSVIVVRPLTRLKIEDIAQKNDAVSSEVFLNVGSIKVDIKPASTKRVEFKAKTPVATASVRGTAGIITADGELIGTSGTWSYVNSAGLETAVDAGSVVFISDTGMITPAQDTVVAKASEVSIKTLADSTKNTASIVAEKNETPEVIEIPTVASLLEKGQVIIDPQWGD